jgi:hypothetical protein
MLGYLGVAYITHATQGFYTYKFLDPKKEKGFLAAYIAGIPVGECLIFTGVRFICLFRQKLTSRGNGGAGGSVEALDEWEQIERSKSSECSSA